MHDGIEISTFQPEDALGVARLFTAVYGDGYPVKLVYDPDALVAAFESGENIPVVARASDGEIVGYIALYRSAPSPAIYEAGQGLVLPAYRARGINRLLLESVFGAWSQTPGADVIFGEAVCNHTHMQKAVLEYGVGESALEVDLIPGEAYQKEGSAAGRVATLFIYQIRRDNPATVYLPPAYAAALPRFYDDLAGRRSFLPADPHCTVPRSRSDTRVFPFAAVARVTVEEVGSDFAAAIDEEERRFLAEGLVVVQVWLKLACPWSCLAVDALRARGYFLGGILPLWFGTDGLLMQKVAGRPNWEGINLYSDRAREILGIVRKDWEETSPSTA